MGSKLRDLSSLDELCRSSPYEYDSTGMPGSRTMVLGNSEVVSGSLLALGSFRLVQSPLAPWFPESPPSQSPDAGSAGTIG